MIYSIFASLLLVSSAASQTVGGNWETLGQIEGAAWLDVAGGALAVGPDFDGDGILEIAIGSNGHNNALGNQVGLLQLCSGRTGAILWEYEPIVSDQSPVTGSLISFVPDLNGDGVPDLLVGNSKYDGSKGGVVILSGLDGSLIREHFGVVGAVHSNGEQLGMSLLGTQDLDGDGLGDYFIGSSGSENLSGARLAGRIDCWSGGTGQLLWQRYGLNEGDFFGQTLVFGTDSFGTGLPDILTSTNEDFNGVSNAGMVYALFQLSGVILQSYPPDTTNPAQGFGVAIAVLPDLDGDQVEELIVGAPWFDSPNLRATGYVTMISSATGLPIWRTDGKVRNGNLGGALLAVEDLNQDGYQEIAVFQSLPFQTDHPRTLILNGRDGEVLWEFKGESQYTNFGVSMGSFDRNGDGLPELFIGEPGYGPGFPGRVVVLSLDPYLRNKGSLSLSGSAQSELRFQVDFPTSESGKSFGILASASGNSSTVIGGVKVPLTFDPFFLRSLQNPPANFRGTLNQEGNHLVQVRVPAGQLSNLIGTTLYFAAMSYSGTQASLSSVAIPIVVVP